MTKKNILLASFIPKDKIDWFLELLLLKFNIKSKYVFIFDYENDESCMLTYSIQSANKINLKDLFYKTLIIHKKKSTIYTINALNKLIEIELGVESGNVNYKDITIEWEKYQDKLILTDNNNVVINQIKRIFL